MPEVLPIRVPCLQSTKIDLPPELEGLYDLAYNLWWSWRPEARQLFSSIDSACWALYRNPVELLINVDRPHWDALVENDTFMASFSSVMRAFEAYMTGDLERTWFRQRFPAYSAGPVAYFSMEYGVHQSLRVYSGGLGVLSGDHCKGASDLGVPLVAVGLLYRFGYFRQAVDADGFQQHIYPADDFSRLPVRPVAGRTGGELLVKVPFPGREVAAKVWLAQVGRVPLVLLDTDVPQNDPADRPIASVLYVRGREMRFCQELLLGAGGVKAVEALDIKPAVWHLNEGHSALLQLERWRRCVREEKVGFEEAVTRLRRDVVFTTHTPVPAGHEQFEQDLARKYLDVWAQELGSSTDRLLQLGYGDHGEPGQPLNLTAFALRNASYVNGVSRINAEVSNRMWRHLLPSLGDEERLVQPITNGVHLSTWMGVEIRELLARTLGPGWLEEPGSPADWEKVGEISNEQLWAAHLAQKQRLGRFIRSRLRSQYARHGASPDELRTVAGLFDEGVLTIGFARRFATYKRANLLFSDLHRLRQILLRPGQSIQIVVAGKAHPADRPGQQLIQHIFNLSQENDLRGKVFFLENYDIRVGRMLIQGVDVWLNTPRRPMEASGTSGQKAAVNGVLNCSILDGWWPEGYDGHNGWAIGGQYSAGDENTEDREDALALYRLLEEEVVPAFYRRDDSGLPQEWTTMMKRSIATIAPNFSAARMVQDYVEKAYLPLANR